MKSVLLAPVFAGLACAPASAEGVTLTLINGTCAIAQIAGRPIACTTPATVTYGHLKNGRTLFTLLLPDNRGFSFVGDRDVQPKPEDYVLFLKRVRIATDAQHSSPTDVTGTCKVNVSADGRLMHRILCAATDAAGAKYLLDFKGDGKPVKTQTF